MFEKYLGSFVLFSWFLFKKKTPLKKKWLSLFFLLTFFLICSLFCRIFMFTLLAVTLLILHAFSLFFSSFFLFPCFLSLCFLSLSLPLAMFIYSLSLSWASSDYYFLKNHLYLFSKKKKSCFFICSSLFCKTVFVLSPLLFRPFSCLFLFFSIVFFRTR